MVYSFSATIGSKNSPPSWWSEEFWGSRNITSLPPLRTKDEIFAFRLSMPKVADLNSLNLRQTSKLPHWKNKVTDTSYFVHGVCKGKGDIFSVKLAKCFSCVLLISFVNYAECVMCAVCPRYSLHKSNAMLKHCGGSPKWLEAQSLQGTLLQPFRRIERLPINPQAHLQRTKWGHVKRWIVEDRCYLYENQPLIPSTNSQQIALHNKLLGKKERKEWCSWFSLFNIIFLLLRDLLRICWAVNAWCSILLSSYSTIQQK